MADTFYLNKKILQCTPIDWDLIEKERQFLQGYCSDGGHPGAPGIPSDKFEGPQETPQGEALFSKYQQYGKQTNCNPIFRNHHFGEDKKEMKADFETAGVILAAAVSKILEEGNYHPDIRMVERDNSPNGIYGGGVILDIIRSYDKKQEQEVVQLQSYLLREFQKRGVKFLEGDIRVFFGGWGVAVAFWLPNPCNRS